MGERLKVEPCARCKSLKPLGATYHAPLVLDADVERCEHGNPYPTQCDGTPCPPRCCQTGGA